MTIARILTTSMLRDPDAIAIVDGKTRLTYREWHIEVQKLAGGPAALGLKPGAHLRDIEFDRIDSLVDLIFMKAKIAPGPAHDSDSLTP